MHPTPNVVAAGLLVFGITLTVAEGARTRRTRLPELGLKRAEASAVLGGRGSSFTLDATSGILVIRGLRDQATHEIALSLVAGGVARPLRIHREDLRAAEKGAFAAALPITLGGEEVSALFDLHVDAATDAIAAELHFLARGKLGGAHDVAVRMETKSLGRPVFVSGTGELSDLGMVTGSVAVIDLLPRPLGFASAGGALAIALEAPDAKAKSATVSFTSPEASFDGTKDVTVGMRALMGESSTKIWRNLFAATGTPTARVRGVVTGTTERAQVFGLDNEGAPRVRFRAEEGGRFEVHVPKETTQWYAALDPTRTSAPVTFTPGLPWDLRLDVSPGGELTLRVKDQDSGAPLTARLVVHGIDGTLDPSFGPDYRASGAGPIIDSLRGEITTPLPAGRYRVAATKGIEWTVDTKILEITGGHSASAELALRHVVPTPGVVGCDLHVHARPSFDSPVSPEDRVLSLVAAGIDFAVPSEHNLVGDYGPALELTGLEGQLAWVSGVEVTTFGPRLGHFGVFPHGPGPVPPYRRTSVDAIFAAAHRDPSSVLVVHHPRLPQAIGYFELFNYSPPKPPPPRMRTDFDALEVYNGYDAGKLPRVEAVLRDFYALLNLGKHYAATGSSDSHRIQYTWAGYPRTMVDVGDDAAGGGGKSIDTKAVVAAVKAGRSSVTSGPILDVSVEGTRPGSELKTAEDTVRVHVVARAAPWIDLTSLEVVVGGREVARAEVPSHPSVLEADTSAPDEAARRTIRYEGDLTVTLPKENTWLMVVAKGTRAMDDILPFMPVVPFGFTNPVWIVRP